MAPDQGWIQIIRGRGAALLCSTYFSPRNEISRRLEFTLRNKMASDIGTVRATELNAIVKSVAFLKPFKVGAGVPKFGLNNPRQKKKPVILFSIRVALSCSFFLYNGSGCLILWEKISVWICPHGKHAHVRVKREA